MDDNNYFIELSKALIPALVTIIGWVIIFQQSMSMKFRDDVKEIIDSSVSTVDEIFELSKTYYDDNEVHIGIDSANIRSKFLLLSHYLILLKEKGLDTDLGPYLLAYKKSVMGDYFETVNFKKQMEIPDRSSDIPNSRSELNFRINMCFLRWSQKITFISQFSLGRKNV